MKYPTYVRVDGEKFKINTNYKVALECDKVCRDVGISDYERTLTVIYLLFGEKGLNAKKHYKKLIELAIRFLKCDENDNQDDSFDTPNMDFEQDFWLIVVSFESDYRINLLKRDYMHWWDFYYHLNGLTENCLLNRVRELRDYDLNKVKDPKEKKKLEKAKKRFSLKEEEVPLTDEQRKSVDNFYRLTGIERKE